MKYKWFWIFAILLIINFIISDTAMFLVFKIYLPLRYGIFEYKDPSIWVQYQMLYWNLKAYVQPFVLAAIMGTSLKILYDILKKLDIEN